MIIIKSSGDDHSKRGWEEEWKWNPPHELRSSHEFILSHLVTTSSSQDDSSDPNLIRPLLSLSLPLVVTHSIFLLSVVSISFRFLCWTRFWYLDLLISSSSIQYYFISSSSCVLFPEFRDVLFFCTSIWLVLSLLFLFSVSLVWYDETKVGRKEEETIRKCERDPKKGKIIKGYSDGGQEDWTTHIYIRADLSLFLSHTSSSFFYVASSSCIFSYSLFSFASQILSRIFVSSCRTVSSYWWSSWSKW